MQSARDSARISDASDFEQAVLLIDAEEQRASISHGHRDDGIDRGLRKAIPRSLGLNSLVIRAKRPKLGYQLMQFVLIHSLLLLLKHMVEGRRLYGRFALICRGFLPSTWLATMGRRLSVSITLGRFPQIDLSVADQLLEASVLLEPVEGRPFASGRELLVMLDAWLLAGAELGEVLA